jgi:hypothetical protein
MKSSLAASLDVVVSVSTEMLSAEVIRLAMKLISQDHSPLETWNLIERAIRPLADRLAIDVAVATVSDPIVRKSIVKLAARTRGVRSGESRGAQKKQFLDWATDELSRNPQLTLADLAATYAKRPNSLPPQGVSEILCVRRFAELAVG